MQSSILVDTLDTHTAGEPTRIVSGGLDTERRDGDSVAAARDQFAANSDHLRRLLLQEPRGHDDMFGAVPVPPGDDDADLGVFFMDNDGYLEMCGHATIGIISAFIETGRLPATDQLTLETPAGPVDVRPSIDNGRVEAVSLRNVSSFFVRSADVTVTVDETTLTVSVDVVSAGNVFALVDIEELPLALDPANIDTLVAYGLAIRSEANKTLDIEHPITGESLEMSLVEIYNSSGDVDRNITVFANGMVDRSPCGTGTCAKMTLLHHKGILGVDELYPHKSVIGTQFTGRIVNAESQDGLTVTSPEVTGSAYIIGKHTFTLDDRDPLTNGFTLG